MSPLKGCEQAPAKLMSSRMSNRVLWAAATHSNAVRMEYM